MTDGWVVWSLQFWARRVYSHGRFGGVFGFVILFFIAILYLYSIIQILFCTVTTFPRVIKCSERIVHDS